MPEISLFQVSTYQEICQTDSLERFDKRPDQNTLKNRKYLTAAASSMRCQPPFKPQAEITDDSFFYGRSASTFNFNYVFTESWLYDLPQAHLMGSAWAVQSFERYLIQDSYHNPQLLMPQIMTNQLKVNLGHGMSQIPFALYRHELSTQAIEADAYLPVYYWHFNYHHWLIECLPLLLEYRDNPRLHSLKLILPAQLNAFQQATLDLLQIPTEKIVFFQGNDCTFKRLWVPTLGNFLPQQLQSVKSSLFAAAKIQPLLPQMLSEPGQSTQRKRLYISRTDATERRVSNEQQLIPLLKQYGFEMLELGSLSLSEQMHWMNQASVLMGPHGAGLSNLIFTPSDCLLLELMPRDTINHCFWLLSNALRAQNEINNYAYLTGPVTSAQRDFNIDPKALESLLKELFMQTEGL